MKMNKNKYFLKTILAFILCLSFNVKAENMGYYLSNSNQNYNYDSASKEIMVKRGDYIYVTSVINHVSESELKLQKGRLTVRWDSNQLELASYGDNFYSTSSSNFANLNITVDSKTDNKITLNYTADDTIINGINKLVEFKFHVLDNAKLGTFKIYEMDGEDSITCLGEGDISIPCGNSYYSELKYNIESSKVNTLSSLKIDGKVVDGFIETKKEYNVNIDEKTEKINIEAIEKDPKSSVSGDIGSRELKYGINTFNIDVTSESGVKNTYTINVTRIDGRSKNNTLKSLKTSSGIINYKSDIKEYNISVKNEIDTITIYATLADNKAKFKEDFTKKEIDLIEGINKVMITVIAENNDENTYTINITRELSSNNTLKELMVNNELIKLSKNEFLYNYKVGNEIENVTIDAVATDSKAKVDIAPFSSLQVGDNEIGIRVTAPNGEFVNYTLVVTREPKLSNNSKLKSIVIDGYKLSFNKDIEYYDLKIKEEDSLNIKVEQEDEKAEVNIEGNNNLINGSIIKINVKAEDGTYTRYFINIEKKKNSNLLLWIILLIILIAIILTVIIMLLKKNKKKKIKVEKENDLEKVENDNITVENDDVKKVVVENTTQMENTKKTIDIE